MRIVLTGGQLDINPDRDPGEVVFEVYAGSQIETDGLWFEVAGELRTGRVLDRFAGNARTEFRLENLPAQGPEVADEDVGEWMGSVTTQLVENDPDLQRMSVMFCLRSPEAANLNVWVLELTPTFDERIPSSPEIHLRLPGFDPQVAYPGEPNAPEPVGVGRYERDEVV